MRSTRLSAISLAVLVLAACSRGEGGGDAGRLPSDSARAAAAPADDTLSVPVFTDSTAGARTDSAAEGAGDGLSFTLRVSPRLPPYTFTLVTKGDSGVVAIRAREEGGVEEQVLRTSGDESGSILEPGARLSVRDIDFDGHRDLAFVTTSAQANAWADYWRFDPRARHFVPVGNFPLLEPDSAARELASFTRGGHGGRLWTASRYRWADGRLTEVRREAQDFDDATQQYVSVVSELQGGKLVETRRAPLAEEEVRPGPSWEPDSE